MVPSAGQWSELREGVALQCNQTPARAKKNQMTLDARGLFSAWKAFGADQAQEH